VIVSEFCNDVLLLEWRYYRSLKECIRCASTYGQTDRQTDRPTDIVRRTHGATHRPIQCETSELLTQHQRDSVLFSFRHNVSCISVSFWICLCSTVFITFSMMSKLFSKSFFFISVTVTFTVIEHVTASIARSHDTFQLGCQNLAENFVNGTLRYPQRFRRAHCLESRLFRSANMM